ncbi:unnamed protein product [[Actinomadura] parvosata subsp. kistnae]|nr:unnamed protein product [Actinomadura parvosata subsp. kistnae]
MTRHAARSFVRSFVRAFFRACLLRVSGAKLSVATGMLGAC